MNGMKTSPGEMALAKPLCFFFNLGLGAISCIVAPSTAIAEEPYALEPFSHAFIEALLDSEPEEWQALIDEEGIWDTSTEIPELENTTGKQKQNNNASHKTPRIIERKDHAH